MQLKGCPSPLNTNEEEGHSAAAALLFSARGRCFLVRIKCYSLSMYRKRCQLLYSPDVFCRKRYLARPFRFKFRHVASIKLVSLISTRENEF